MASIKIRLAARCEEAGRTNNEDNFTICENLSEDKWAHIADREVELSEAGVLLVVCDGMGGMNAGEVASAIAVKTIEEWFSSANLSRERFDRVNDVKSYIRKAVQAADRAIKDRSAADESVRGMGSTIVLAWLKGNNVYIGWCGDSRAYRFNAAEGLQQLSHDHSYVQELVDKGKLKPEYAFDFPDRNIITRSLGDPNRKANADVQEFAIRNGDVYLLCSDGLTGVLRDDHLAQLIAANTDSARNCIEALWAAGEEEGWDDNATVLICQVISGATDLNEIPQTTIGAGVKEAGGAAPTSTAVGDDDNTAKDETGEDSGENAINNNQAVPKSSKKTLFVILSIILIILACLVYLFKDKAPINRFWGTGKQTEVADTVPSDTTAQPPKDEPTHTENKGVEPGSVTGPETANKKSEKPETADTAKNEQTNEAETEAEVNADSSGIEPIIEDKNITDVSPEPSDTSSIVVNGVTYKLDDDGYCRYEVKEGETLWRIAQSFGKDTTQLMKDNGKTESGIEAGETLRIKIK
jgi:serine/threonine protein phosphatase PrpC